MIHTGNPPALTAPKNERSPANNSRCARKQAGKKRERHISIGRKKAEETNRKSNTRFKDRNRCHEKGARDSTFLQSIKSAPEGEKTTQRGIPTDANEQIKSSALGGVSSKRKKKGKKRRL